MDLIKDVSIITPELLKSLANVPVNSPPEGREPNWDHPASNSLVIYITCAICIPIMALAATGRFYAKLTTGARRFNWADVIFIFSLIVSVVWLVLVLVPAGGRFVGRHIWEIRIGDLDAYQILLTLISQSAWPIAILLVKISVLAMYIEIFGIQRWFRRTCYAAIATITCLHVASTLYYTIACRPRGGRDYYGYLMGYVSRQCLDIFKLLIVQSAVNLAEDLFLVVLPMPCVWALQMPIKQKLGVSAMFLFGLCGVAASAVSLYYRIKLVDSPDQTWEGVYTVIAGVWEAMVGIVLVCLPQIAVLVRRWRHPVASFLSTGHQSSHTTITSQTKRPRTWVQRVKRTLGLPSAWIPTPNRDSAKYMHPHPYTHSDTPTHTHTGTLTHQRNDSSDSNDLNAFRSDSWKPNATVKHTRMTRSWSGQGDDSIPLRPTPHVASGSIHKTTDFTIHVMEGPPR